MRGTLPHEAPTPARAPAPAPVPSPLPRRTILRGAAVAGALAAAGPALLRTAPSAVGASTLVADTPELHLLRRATYGPTATSHARIERIGVNRWLDEQLTPGSIDDDELRSMLDARFEGLRWSIAGANSNLEAFSWDLMFDLGVAAIARAAWSERQLFEVMVDFWSNHLNVTNPFDGGWNTRHDYDRTVIRRHALGSYEDMLWASAQHSAMLIYLNNAESSKESPNENYGRELLELHSVGVGGGYDEDDMRMSALVMTGFTIDWEDAIFVYRPSWHHTGQVSVMGWSKPNTTGAGGYDVAHSYVRYLARHPSTAVRIATKLCERFVSDSPAPALVDALADTYLANDTQIVPVLRRLFRSAAFKGSVGQKTRRPMEDVIATLRVLGFRHDRRGTDGMRALYWMLNDLGNTPMGWTPPNGYPDTADAWRSAGGTLARWNVHMSLAAHWWPDALRMPPLSALVPDPLPATYGALVQALAKKLVFRALPSAHRDAICGFFGRTLNSPLSSNSDVLGWRLPYLVSLILDTPSHLLR